MKKVLLFICNFISSCNDDLVMEKMIYYLQII